MHLRGTSSPTWWLVVSLWLAACVLAVPTLPVLAQEATPGATAASETSIGSTATGPSPATMTPTPTVTRTPTNTPTSTPTLTARQGQLVLAQTFLDGGDYAAAARIFAAVAEKDPGNPIALEGLKAALQSQATAAAAAPLPTPIPPAATPAPAFGRTFGKQFNDFFSTALAGLLLIVLVYLLAQAVRWLLIQGRELWWIQGVVRLRLRREPVPPSFYLGEFADATGIKDFPGARVVAQALTEALVKWKQTVNPDLPQAAQAPSLELEGMSWIKVLWNWIIPPPRIYRITGTLFRNTEGAYLLSLSRAFVPDEHVDSSRTFGPQGDAHAQPVPAIQALAIEARPWLLRPLDAAASAAVVQSLRVAKGLPPEGARSAGRIIEDVLNELLPVRQQVMHEAIDFNDARRRLETAGNLLTELPETSALRADLQNTITELRRHVQPGAAPG